MAIYRRDQPEYNAAVANGAKNIKLTGGGALAGGKTWDGRALNVPTAPASATPRLDGGSATPRLDAGVATPRLDKNPARNTADAVASSNRSGAFGTGPQKLQARKDLFNQMASAKPQDRAKFQGQAAALGVKKGGWDAAMNRLSMGQSSAPAAPMVSTQSAPMERRMTAPASPTKKPTIQPSTNTPAPIAGSQSLSDAASQPAAPRTNTDPQMPPGSEDKGNVWVSPDGSVTKKDPSDPNSYVFDPQSGTVTGTMMAWDKRPPGSRTERSPLERRMR